MIETIVTTIRAVHPSPLEPFEFWLLVLSGVTLTWAVINQTVESAFAAGRFIRQWVRAARVRRDLEATYAQSVRAYRAAHPGRSEMAGQWEIPGATTGMGRTAGYGVGTSLCATDFGDAFDQSYDLVQTRKRIVTDPDAPKDINHIERMR